MADESSDTDASSLTTRCTPGHFHDSDSITSSLHLLRKEPLYATLYDFLLKTGRGRRPSLPDLKAPTNKHLLMLYLLKDETNSTSEMLASWFIKLFPQMNATRGQLEYKTKMLLKEAETSTAAIEEYAITFSALTETLCQLGFTRSGLLSFNFPQKITVTNNLVHALDCFRSKERLEQKFLFQCLLKLNVCLTERQIRHKTSLVLKKIKDLKNKKKNDDLAKYLADPFPGLDTANPDPKVILSRKENEKEIEVKKVVMKVNDKLQASLEKINTLELEVNVLKEERDMLSSYKCLANEASCYRERIKDLESQLDDVLRSKLYVKIAALKLEIVKQNKHIENQGDQLVNCKEEMKNLGKNISNMKVKVKSEQTLKSNYKKKYDEQKQLNKSLEYLLQLENADIQTRQKKNNKFKPDVRCAVMQLQGEANVSAINCSKVIEIVSSNIFGHSFSFKPEDLPSTSSSLSKILGSIEISSSGQDACIYGGYHILCAFHG